jgi:uncharacterized protein involved in exopolysaccharide biosynthesis
MPEAASNKKQDLRFPALLKPAWIRKRKILALSTAIALVTLGINFLLPESFKTTASILPDTDKNRLGVMSQFSGLASLAGLSVPGAEISRLYPVILSSKTLLENVVERKYLSAKFKDSVDLIQYFELDQGSPAKNLDQAMLILKDLLIVNLEPKTSVVTVSLELGEPQFTADVLNATLNELDTFLREKKTNSATEQRKWIESRLVQVNSELRTAEESLKSFREKNRRVTDSPDLVLRQERLLREVEVKGAIDVELLKQAEIAKIEEIKQISTINVLDYGRAPARKEHPKKATNAAISFVLAILSLSGFYIVRSTYGERILKYVKDLNH